MGKAGLGCRFLESSVLSSAISTRADMSAELPPTSQPAALPKSQAELILTVWEKVIDLQMHFNEMCMNLRRTAIGTLGALLAAAALSFRFGGAFRVAGTPVSVALAFVIVAFLVWISFYVMDRFWYHELLRATVVYAGGLAKEASSAGLKFELNMTKIIQDTNHKSLGLTGGDKINLFYLVVALALLVAAWLLLIGAVQPIP